MQVSLHHHCKLASACGHHTFTRRQFPSVLHVRIGRGQRELCRVQPNGIGSHHRFRRQVRASASLPLAETPTEKALLDELLRLSAENAALREALAKYQKVPAAQVTLEVSPDLTFSPASPEIAPPPAAKPAPPAQPSKPPQPQPSSAAAAECELEAGIRWPQAGESPPFYERPPRQTPLTLGGEGASASTPRDQRLFHVVHVTAEMAPYAKVGGLGDVVTGLARACLDRGHNVEVMLPFYECLDEQHVEGLERVWDFDCPKGRVWDGSMQMQPLRTTVYAGRIEGIPVLLVRPNWARSNIFKGECIYGGSYNELEAYLYFSRACLEFLKVSGRQPDIIHAHEWQASAVPMLYWEKYHQEGLSRPRMMLTIHNMDSSGECRQDDFAYTGLPGEMFATVDRALDERTIGHNPERLCLMKGGIVYSNSVTTVSPTYAGEALSGGAAGWLKSTLAQPHIRSKFQGVLNGIDTHLWDPARDPLIPAPFSSSQPLGKALCKRFLQRGLGLREDASKPIVACITRLVPQKGVHLIKHAVQRTLDKGGQFVLLGSGHADGDFRKMAEGPFKGHPDVKLLLMYSEPLAHQMYAACDIILVPSMFEPCGLTQLVGMRYGAIPVVRSTGGLADTVKDVDEDSGLKNGFTFSGIDEASLNSALDRAIDSFRKRPEWWAALSRRNMDIDSSWEQSASSYVSIYSQIAAGR